MGRQHESCAISLCTLLVSPTSLALTFGVLSGQFHLLSIGFKMKSDMVSETITLLSTYTGRFSWFGRLL